jgi:hypothetical protein
MTGFVTRMTVAALLGLGSLTAVPVAALADGVYFSFGDGPRYDNRPRDHEGHRPPDFYDQRPREYMRGDMPPPRPRGFCEERFALRKAWRMGLEDPQIARVTPRRVIVEGAGRHHRMVQVQFANVPGCPEL